MLFTENPGLPVVITLMVVFIAASWLVALQKCSRPLIYATAILKPAILLLVEEALEAGLQACP